MPLPDGRLLTDDIAEVLGIKASDWRSRVSRGYAPQPDDTVVHDGARRTVWRARTFDAYLALRKSPYYLDAAGTWHSTVDGAADLLARLNGVKA